ncbi:MAG: ABC transporter substrate-binding protein [Clostridia bacterium]|nr:ABC transporter substrate-binding protein [Clostridia bacterium]
MKKLISVVLTLVMILSVCSFAAAEDKTSFKVGICNLVDDPSLNQINDNIQSQLQEIAAEKGITFEILYQNCNLDFAVLDQIISDFIYEEVDLMIGIATPVAKAMMTATEDNGIPVVFAAVSDPVGSGLAASMEAPGANVTGTSDALNTAAIFDLIFALDPDVSSVGLLYNPSEDASTAPIAQAKEILTAKGVAYTEYSGTNTVEVQQAVDALIQDGVGAVFTPTDNTIQVAEPTISEALAEAKIPHYAGADSFALVGAFVGYGVDYANLGKETGNMAAAILTEGAEPASTPVMVFDNGKATVNLQVCEALGISYEDTAALFAPYCTLVESIETGESF